MEQMEMAEHEGQEKDSVSPPKKTKSDQVIILDNFAATKFVTQRHCDSKHSDIRPLVRFSCRPYVETP